MNKYIEEIFSPKSNARLKIYAYSIDDKHHRGMLKIGQTTNDVRARIKQQLGTALIKNYKIEFEIDAIRKNGSFFSDREVRNALKRKGHKVEQEWVSCSLRDLKTVISELSSGEIFTGTHTETFPMRQEQISAVNKTYEYFKSVWKEDKKASPRFLWNAKMRFGKTFTSYQLAKKISAKRILVVTFKPAVEDAWRTDLENHKDFDGWQFITSTPKNTKNSSFNIKKPFVYFGSLQDLLGRDSNKKIKIKNKWVHKTKWDLVIFDEYHFGAWRQSTKELFASEEELIQKEEDLLNDEKEMDERIADFQEPLENEKDFLPISSKCFLYLSGTPFKVLASGEFIEEQIFNWTYTDEQREKEVFNSNFPSKPNPYGALPQMRLLTYQMPDELLSIASGGEFDEFDLNTFFKAKGSGKSAEFENKSHVQKWLDIIRGAHSPLTNELLKTGTKPPFPYSDIRLLPYLQHSFWFMPNISSCNAMANLLSERHNLFWHDYKIIVAAGNSAGVGVKALEPVRKAIKGGFDTKTITISCGKLTTGVTVPEWSSILMLRNLKSPETYFQSAFRVQSAWSIKNPDGDNPNEEEVIKPNCFVFDFAPTRALRQLSEYGMRLSPEESNPEKAVTNLLAFLPVLAFDGANMTQIDAGGVLEIAMSGTTSVLLARKWQSAILVNVDNATLKRVLDNPEALAAIESIEDWRSLGENPIETLINKSEKIKELKKKSVISPEERKILTQEEKEFRNKRRDIQKKLKKFAAKIPAFMYLTDFRENTLKDVITKLERPLFRSVTGLKVKDFHLLVKLQVFNTEQMNQAVFAFRRYEDASLRYTGLNTHELSQYGLFDTVVAKE